MPVLKDKIAIVTGAAQGIGRAIVKAFQTEGAQVVVTDIQDDLGRTVAADLGGGCSYARLDVRMESDWERVVAESLGEHGRIDIVVNNAGITGFDEGFEPQDPEHATLKKWRAVHETNLDGLFLGCKHGIRAMRKTGEGSIINIGSRSGIVGIPAASAYASSKGAVRNHTKSVALYCAEQGWRIRCNVIQPAAILTPMWESMVGRGPDREVRMKEFVKDTPLARFGTVEEVASLAVYLGSEASAYMTGAELNLDGGILAGSAAVPKSS